MSSGDVFRALSTGVSSGKTPHTSHAVFVPRPRKYDTVSQPVSAWNNGIAADLAGPKDAATACTGMLWTFFPDPCVIHISSMARVLTIETARTTTSVSLLLIFILRYPHEDASLA